MSPLCDLDNTQEPAKWTELVRFDLFHQTLHLFMNKASAEYKSSRPNFLPSSPMRSPLPSPGLKKGEILLQVMESCICIGAFTYIVFFVSVYLYKCICAMYLRSPLPFPGLLGVSIRGAKCHFRKNLSWSREESETHLTGDGFVKDLPPLCTSKSLPFTLASKWLWKSFLISFNISAEF